MKEDTVRDPLTPVFVKAGKKRRELGPDQGDRGPRRGSFFFGKKSLWGQVFPSRYQPVVKRLKLSAGSRLLFLDGVNSGHYCDENGGDVSACLELDLADRQRG